MRPPAALISSTAIFTPVCISLPSEAITPPMGKMPTTLMLPRDPPLVPVALGATAPPARPPTTSPPAAPTPPATRCLRVPSRCALDAPATSDFLWYLQRHLRARQRPAS